MKRMHTLPFVVIITAALVGGAGCATSEPTPGSAATPTSDAERQDTMDCMALSRTTSPGPGGPRVTVNRDRYERCMTERGHRTETPPR